MFPFKSKRTSLKDAAVMNGFTDYHSHILPGIDDGVKTPEESLKILGLYEKAGVGDLWFTPHVMADVPNTTENIKEKFGQITRLYQESAAKAELTGTIRLHIAAEYMLDSLFEERLENNDLLPLGKSGMHLLVETSFYNPPYNFWDMMERIKSHGYFPVIAHPERYLYMNRKDYARLKEMDVRFQLNLGSLCGLYNSDSKARAEMLVKNRWYNLAGSDTHSYTMINAILDKKEVNVKSLEVFKNLEL